ncbi:unnamed protein product [Cyprideis torosa]|uniref:Uncharacterized protein n=1 Tax=Cyprideis torosa TaxID=163714 RepID=A0A7R8ZM15_9CRUS|nr:unnamed protein product [Cyprideis torosa]CAG0883351.1 unnamed protein product [Cyprideis torosa]
MCPVRSNTPTMSTYTPQPGYNSYNAPSQQIIPPSVSASGTPPPPQAPPTTSCCETGIPVMTDPVSGQTVCSCQYDSAKVALQSYSRLSNAAALGSYPTYPSTDQNPYPSIGVDSSTLYSSLGSTYRLKNGTTPGDISAWGPGVPQPAAQYYANPYMDPSFAYRYNTGYDLTRRKNATRESTATLKAWLNEHKKNPYPTKGEKIMLAIITKMTLTQVSTWFANARRRLKKENKMTWEPKNRVDDEDALVSDDDSERGGKDLDGKLGVIDRNPDEHVIKDEWKDVNKMSPGDDGKPKIWSLADTAACKTPPPHGIPFQGNPAAGPPGWCVPPRSYPYPPYSGIFNTSDSRFPSAIVPPSAASLPPQSDGVPLPPFQEPLPTDTPPQTPPSLKPSSNPSQGNFNYSSSTSVASQQSGLLTVACESPAASSVCSYRPRSSGQQQPSGHDRHDYGAMYKGSTEKRRESQLMGIRTYPDANDDKQRLSGWRLAAFPDEIAKNSWSSLVLDHLDDMKRKKPVGCLY